MEVEGQPEVKKVEVEQVPQEKEEKIKEVEEHPEPSTIEAPEVIDTPSPVEEPVEEEEQEVKQEAPIEESTPIVEESKEAQAPEVMISSDSQDGSEEQIAPLAGGLDTNDLLKANTSTFEDEDYQPRAQSMALSTEPFARTQTSAEKRQSSIQGIGELQERMVDKWRKDTAAASLNVARSEFYELR